MQYQIVGKDGKLIKAFNALSLAKEWVHYCSKLRKQKLEQHGGWLIKDLQGNIYDTSAFVTSPQSKKIKKKDSCREASASPKKIK